jgi:tetratricopeptide (TPR) repeat protein
MAGRWISKWSLSGCLIVGALGCNRNSVQTTDAQPISGFPMTSTTNNKSLWGNSTPQPVAEVPVEAPRKGPAKPETDVAIADLRLQVAFDEKTPETSRANMLDQARLGYQKALQQDPKNKAAMLGLARYYSRVGEREKTLEMYEKYLAINPSDREVMHEVAIIYARWQDWNIAVAWCDRALKVDPENLSYSRTKAFCLARAGKWEQAFEIFITKMRMPEAQARYNIARVLEHQNHLDAARQQLQIALQKDPNLAEAREFLAEMDQPPVPSGPIDPNAIQRTGFNPEP